MLDGRLACFDRGSEFVEFVPLTRDYVASLEDHLRAHLRMMRGAFPDRADNWTWGRCDLRDLAYTEGLSFTFGGDDDRSQIVDHADLPDGVDVLVVVERFCRVCGCTDEEGCVEGCEWTGDNLCSVCATANTSDTDQAEKGEENAG